MRISPDNITELKKNEIFVFGANESFRHGAGAARQALQWGAKHGKSGLQGQTYGIPTKDYQIETLPLDDIKDYVDEFINYAKKYPDLKFLCSAVGCGLAGYEVKDIAPLFVKAIDVENIYLPQTFWDYFVDKGFILH